MPDKVDILNSCLRAIESGKATVEDCIARYPDVKGLENLLRLALAMRQQAPVKMPEARKIALERRLVQVMKTRTRQPQPWLRFTIGFAALLIVLSISSFGSALLARSALPGDVLYGYKRAIENAQLHAASKQNQAFVLQEIVKERFNEMGIMIEVRHQVINAAYLTDVTESIKAAAQADPSIRDGLYQQYSALLQRAVLSEPPSQTGLLSTALAELISPTPFATPTLTNTASFTPTFTAMPPPTSTATATATDTGTATFTAAPTSTATPTFTFTPSNTASPRPSSTPTFTPTASRTPTVPTATPTRLPPTATRTPLPTATPLPSPTPLPPTATPLPYPTLGQFPPGTMPKLPATTLAPCPSPTPTFTPVKFGNPPTVDNTRPNTPVPCLTWTPTPQSTHTVAPLPPVVLTSAPTVTPGETLMAPASGGNGK